MMVVGGSSATSFEDLDSMARTEQFMEYKGYDVVKSFITDLHNEDIYVFVMNYDSNTTAPPLEVIDDTFNIFAITVHEYGFSVDGMAVFCGGLGDDYYGYWYISRELADSIWYYPIRDKEYYIDQVLETYSIDTDF